MKTIIYYISLIAGLLLIPHSYAWLDFSLTELEVTNHSGSVYGEHQQPQQIRVIQDQDAYNFYVFIELEGIKPEEVDIQRHGQNITIRQTRGRMEEAETQSTYRSFESFSSFTRRLVLPLEADPDVSKMQRENKEKYIFLGIPKRLY